MPRPKISVVVPAYNEAKTLGLCLASLKNQDFKKPYEVIVVDNNSTDATAAIARTARVKLIKEIKRGAAAARNTGAAASSAPLLAFTDADSIVPSHWLSYISQSFSLNPRLAAVVGNFQFPHGNKLLGN